MLSGNWQTIVSDIEMLQAEGLEVARVVEEIAKLVKKGDEEVGMPDGMKDR